MMGDRLVASGTLEARFADAMARLLPANPPERIAIAVSGGGDSTALMYLAAAWARDAGVALHIVSIDHGLREEAAAELAKVAQQAEKLDLPHTILTWSGWDGTGNLQQSARDARRALLEYWRGGISHILLGHTMDDQAETFCINLARGSGAAGLCGMAENSPLTVADPMEPQAISGPMPAGDPVRRGQILRPLLWERRQVLRKWLTENGIDWSDDPSNDDPKFDRVRVRTALRDGDVPGIDVETLAATAARMQRVREALDRRGADVLRRIARTSHGDVLFDRDGLLETEAETRMALMAHALQWVSSAQYRPRFSALNDVIVAVEAGRASTLHGCLITVRDGGVRVTREEKAVHGLESPLNGETWWDSRWVISGPDHDGAVVRALGQNGLTLLDRMPAESLPRPTLASLPAIWEGDQVLALPGLLPGDWGAELRPAVGGFGESLSRS